jgi:DNA-binding GntR family transcriptional regulator
MTPTHTVVRDDLRRRITSGEFAPREALPDLETLGRSYLAEPSTVRRALHELAGEGLVVLNLQAIVTG